MAKVKQEFTLTQIIEIAKQQKNLIFVICAELLMILLMLFTGLQLPQIINKLLIFGLSVAQIFLFYKLALATRWKMTWFYIALVCANLISSMFSWAIGEIIGILLFVCLLRLNSEVNKILKSEGVKTGLFGVSSSELKSMQARIAIN